MKRQLAAFITGVTGQDGSYLAELLLNKGYKVYGLVRRGSTVNTHRIEHLCGSKHGLKLRYGDLSDEGSLRTILSDVRPDEIYNLGAQSDVRISFDIPEYTADITALGTLRMLEAMRHCCPRARFYQASSDRKSTRLNSIH